MTPKDQGRSFVRTLIATADLLLAGWWIAHASGWLPGGLLPALQFGTRRPIPSAVRTVPAAAPAPAAPQHAPAPASPPAIVPAISGGIAIRVNLTPDPVRELPIEVAHPFQLRLPGTQRILHRSPRAEKFSVVQTATGLRFGGVEYGVTRLEIVPDKTPAIWVDGHQYRGSVQVSRRGGGLLVAINTLPLEEYVASVVDSEMPAEFSPEARKAQAIVARTFALYQMRNARPDALGDVYATTRSQKYLGFQYRADNGRLLAGESESSRAAAAATRGVVCLDRGQLFCTYYHAACGGHTLVGTQLFPDAAAPVQAVPCDWCKPARLYRWSATVNRPDFEADLLRAVASRSPSAKSIRGVTALPAAPGQLPQFQVRTDRQTLQLTGADLRTPLSRHGVYSPQFSLTDTGAAWQIDGRGHGHGVGLCQWGARGQAHAGHTFLQIIRHYYPGVTLAVLNTP